MDRYDIAIVIVNYRQYEYTKDCIDSILKYSSAKYKVYLIDNGSIEEEFNALIYYYKDRNAVKFIKSHENIGYAGGVNLGLKAAQKTDFDYFIVMNNDTVIEKETIPNLLSAIKNNDKSIISAIVYDYAKKNLIQYVGTNYKEKNSYRNLIDSGQFNGNIEFDMIDDVMWIFPRTLYCEIGEYSEDFFFNNEQADFVIRAKKNGYKTYVCSEAKIFHKGSVSIGGRDENHILTFYSIRATTIFNYKHKTKTKFCLYFLTLITNITIRYLQSVITRNKKVKNRNTIKFYAVVSFLKWKRNNILYIPQKVNRIINS